MKKNLFIAELLILLFCLSGCSVAYDDSVHTARFYFYNFTDEPFYAKLTPKDFKAQEKFRQQKTDYIYPKADNEESTEPDFSFSWIPGEFYIKAFSEESQEYSADLDIYIGKKKKITLETNAFNGVPSAEDYDCQVCVVQTFTQKEYTEESYQKNLDLITDYADKEKFSSIYVQQYSSERQTHYYGRNNTFYDVFMNKDSIRDAEKVIEKYGLEKGPVVYLLFVEEKRGAMKYEYREY